MTVITEFLIQIPAPILRQNHKNCQMGGTIPVMDLIVATDGSWKGYDVEEFIS